MLLISQVIEEGNGTYPSLEEEEPEEENERVPTDIDVEGVELIASYWWAKYMSLLLPNLIKTHGVFLLSLLLLKQTGTRFCLNCRILFVNYWYIYSTIDSGRHFPM